VVLVARGAMLAASSGRYFIRGWLAVVSLIR